ncbi:uncharacterized protein B0H18DRAFT_137183 [Fomitopsis serialis]|uniref:uncharacterized protein n=1 Tax=Fomitopsis serialis TaxID=139415 RepID=UPI0020074C45|nr:uncharacterized protein B0H18DRAFT_137183 [Neoantrodia serialis]KAH9914350.1 hypothetical protein B0H18DRAFT_137183 [Neoantrodia serialis]
MARSRQLHDRPPLSNFRHPVERKCRNLVCSLSAQRCFTLFASLATADAFSGREGSLAAHYPAPIDARIMADVSSGHVSTSASVHINSAARTMAGYGTQNRRCVERARCSRPIADIARLVTPGSIPGASNPFDVVTRPTSLTSCFLRAPEELWSLSLTICARRSPLQRKGLHDGGSDSNQQAAYGDQAPGNVSEMRMSGDDVQHSVRGALKCEDGPGGSLRVSSEDTVERHVLGTAQLNTNLRVQSHCQPLVTRALRRRPRRCAR